MTNTNLSTIAPEVTLKNRLPGKATETTQGASQAPPPPALRSRSSEPEDEGPCCWIARDALKRIRDHYQGKRGNGDRRSIVLLVYYALAERAGEVQSADLGKVYKEQIADECGISVRSVCDALYKLEQIQLIEIGRSRTPGRKCNETNRYRLLSCPGQNGSSAAEGGLAHEPR